MYSLEVRENIDKTFARLAKKNPKQILIIEKKLAQVLKNPHRFKPMRAPMQNLRRVHIDKSFVLVYSIDEGHKVVIVEDYDHHDRIYM